MSKRFAFFGNTQSNNKSSFAGQGGLKQERQCTNKRNIEARSPNIWCSGKATSIAYSEFVLVASFIHHAKRFRSLFCNPWHVWLYHTFLHYFIKGTIFRKKILNIKCVLILCYKFRLKYFS